MLIERRREVGGAQDVVRKDVAELLKPKKGELRENAALIRDRGGHDDVEGGKTIGGDDEEFVAEVVDIANLAARDGRDTRKVSFANHLRCR